MQLASHSFSFVFLVPRSILEISWNCKLQLIWRYWKLPYILPILSCTSIMAATSFMHTCNLADFGPLGNRYELCERAGAERTAPFVEFWVWTSCPIISCTLLSCFGCQISLLNASPLDTYYTILSLMPVYHCISGFPERQEWSTDKKVQVKCPTDSKRLTL